VIFIMSFTICFIVFLMHVKIIIWLSIINGNYKDLAKLGKAIHGKNQLNGFDMY
jgi:hypothetical protein